MANEFNAQAQREQASRVLLGMANSLQVTPSQLAECFNTSEQTIKLAGQGQWDKLSTSEEARLHAELRKYNDEYMALLSPAERIALLGGR